MSLNCIDAAVGNAAPLFAQGLAFQNPILDAIDSVLGDLGDLISQPELENGQWLDADSVVCLTALQNFIPVFTDYTQFISGRSSVFPATVLASSVLAPTMPPGAGVLAPITFTELLGTLSGGLVVQRAMCQADQNNPCALVSGIFGVVSDPGALQLSMISDGLPAIMTSTLGMTVCEWVQQMIDGLASLIVSGIAAILAAIRLALSYSLGKSLQGLFANPCFASYLLNITTSALQNALLPKSS